MFSSLRSLSGSLTLLALLLSVGVAFQASLCSPGECADDPGVIAYSGFSGEDAGEEDCTSRGGEDSAPHHCPISPLGMTGSCGAAASIPSSDVLSPGSSDLSSFALEGTEGPDALLHAHRFFHPPRA